MKNTLGLLICSILFTICSCKRTQNRSESTIQSIRFASYNVALFRSEEGALANDLKSGKDIQIQNVAAVIQEVRPDVIALMEFDYDPTGKLLDDFQNKYLSVDQHGKAAIQYPYKISIPSNTGILSGFDLNNDGSVSLPNDGFGYGKYNGQYAFALLSKYPIDTKHIRSFQKMLWKDMPEAKRPMNEDGTYYYDDQEWDVFRLSSKNHIDIPIQIPNGKTTHVILAHPTPPVFDGPEDRNGLRNYDEIRLLKDYISNANYLLDDKGKKGGLKQGVPFVVMGDLNADPIDGDSYPGAITQLLESPLVHATVARDSLIPKSKGGKVYDRSKKDKGNPAYDTSFFGKRIDYVLPSKQFNITKSGVFWPAEGESLYEQVRDKKASDHLLVWVEGYIQ